jgi:hypothetical protein
MLSIIFLFLLISNIKKIILHKLCETKNKYSGYDERPLNQTYVNMYEVRKNHERMKLIKKLQSLNITDETKLKLIFESYLVDDLNPNVVKPPNLLKGLKF